MLLPAISLSVLAALGQPLFHGSTLVPTHWLMRVPVRGPHAGWISPAARGKALLYVANYESPGSVEIYDAKGHNQSPVGEITSGLSGPEGMAVDRHHSLYVTNTNNNTVTVYLPGQTTPSKTYSQGLDGPAGDVVGRDGTLYVSNLFGNNVVAYAHGSMSPTTTYTGLNFPIGLTLDASNNLYVANEGAGDIIEFPSGSTNGKNLGISMPEPSGIAIDSAGNIVVSNQMPPAIDVYPPGATSPSETFGQEGDPNPIAFLRSEKLLFAGEPLSSTVNVYSYPSGTKINAITVGDVFPAGLAVSPASPF